MPSLLTADGSDCPAGTQILELLTVAGYDRFHHLKIANARSYRQKKQEVFDAMLDVLERRYVPNLRKHLCFKMTGSEKGWLINPPKLEFARPASEQFWLRDGVTEKCFVWKSA